MADSVLKSALIVYFSTFEVSKSCFSSNVLEIGFGEKFWQNFKTFLSVRPIDSTIFDKSYSLLFNFALNNHEMKIDQIIIIQKNYKFWSKTGKNTT